MEIWVIAALAALGIFAVLRWFSSEGQKEHALKEMMKRREQAEDHIMLSGDEEAVETLRRARANPAEYTRILRDGMNAGNDTLRVALGVMAGIIAGNIVTGAAGVEAIQNALDEMHAQSGSLDDLYAADEDEADEPPFDDFGVEDGGDDFDAFG